MVRTDSSLLLVPGRPAGTNRLKANPDPSSVCLLRHGPRRLGPGGFCWGCIGQGAAGQIPVPTHGPRGRLQATTRVWPILRADFFSPSFSSVLSQRAHDCTARRGCASPGPHLPPVRRLTSQSGWIWGWQATGRRRWLLWFPSPHGGRLWPPCVSSIGAVRPVLHKPDGLRQNRIPLPQIGPRFGGPVSSVRAPAGPQGRAGRAPPPDLLANAHHLAWLRPPRLTFRQPTNAL